MRKQLANDERGTKREDPDTGKKFYDLNKDPIVSPYTGKSYPRSFFEQNAVAAVRAKAAVVSAAEDDEEEVEVEEGADLPRALAGRDLAPHELEALGAYSRAIGLAFQVVDDVLDATEDSATLGKTAGKDAAANKPTYVSILGLAPSKALAEQLRQQAHDALAPFGEQAQRLREIADLIVQRKA